MKIDMQAMLSANNPHAVPRPIEPQSSTVEKQKLVLANPGIVLEQGGWGGGSYTTAISEDVCVLVCSGTTAELASLTPYTIYGSDHDHGHESQWRRTDYYVSLESDKIPRYSPLKKLVADDRVVVFTLPKDVTTSLLQALERHAGKITVLRAQIFDQKRTLEDLRSQKDNIVPTEYRAMCEASNKHIANQERELRELYERPLCTPLLAIDNNPNAYAEHLFNTGNLEALINLRNDLYDQAADLHVVKSVETSAAVNTRITYVNKAIKQLQDKQPKD